MKDQFHELTIEEFLEEITRQEQSFFQKKAAELYFRENSESSIKHLFPPIFPQKITSENNANNKASISETEFQKISFSEKLPNGDIALHVNEMQKGKGGKESKA
ncbi:hypothetical protein HAX54_042815 [Datura stramonium]|uniref:Uncharacterized protein n=1 Tax=Datura stramonium TaxID=4076 RepID=A0ABS8SMT2_DATST|nr:hypothetical protein [Datura stramonium]